VTVYAKRMNWKQRGLAAKYEKLCGFEFLYQDEIDDGSMTFAEAWGANYTFLEDVLAEVQNINTRGACKHD